MSLTGTGMMDYKLVGIQFAKSTRGFVCSTCYTIIVRDRAQLLQIQRHGQRYLCHIQLLHFTCHTQKLFTCRKAAQKRIIMTCKRKCTNCNTCIHQLITKHTSTLNTHTHSESVLSVHVQRIRAI